VASESLIGALESCPEAGFAASKMLYYDNPEIIDRAGDSYTRAGAGEWIFGACAGAALYRTRMLRDTGIFDEDFFLLYEDVDLSFKAQLKGYKCLYVPEAIVHHKASSSIIYDSPTSVYYGHRNLEWVYIKNMPAGCDQFWLIFTRTNSGSASRFLFPEKKRPNSGGITTSHWGLNERL
jgi:GT2 family glycosyltransferase